MSYIAPNTDLWLCRNVPLDPSYEHTIYFENATAQMLFFRGKRKIEYDNLSYQRVNKGSLKVATLADNIYDCNYLVFRNESFGNKYFYAFITSVEFINPNTSLITYELDVIQTWFFDYSIKKCYVEREHAMYDAIGSNILPEPVAIGEYVYNNYSGIGGSSLSETYTVVCINGASKTSVGESTGGYSYQGVFNYCMFMFFKGMKNPDDSKGFREVAMCKGYLDSYNEHPDDVLSVYTVPSAFVPTRIKQAILTNDLEADSYERRLEDSDTLVNNLEYDLLSATSHNSGTIDGYKPKNNKLFTYPFNLLHIENTLGSALNLRYEYFKGGNAKVNLRGSIIQPVEVILNPIHYGNRVKYSYTQQLTIDTYPLCGWSSDYYSAWIAQNALPNQINALSSAVGIAGGLASGLALGNPVISTMAVAGGVSTAFSTLANYISQDYKASIHADINKGTLKSGNADIGAEILDFYYARMSVHHSYAAVIDDFFERYGYTTNSLKVPNRNGRPHWNYIKTANFDFEGSLPADDAKKLVQIYNNGITFWKNGNEIGDYTLDNSIGA